MKFALQDGGSVVILYPRDEEARIWIEDHTDDDTLTWCSGIVIEPRHLEMMNDAIKETGGTIEPY